MLTHNMVITTPIAENNPSPSPLSLEASKRLLGTSWLNCVVRKLVSYIHQLSDYKLYISQFKIIEKYLDLVSFEADKVSKPQKVKLTTLVLTSV